MRLYQIRRLVTDVWRIYWDRRARPYVRIAVALITLGGLAATTSLGVLAFQFFTQAAGLPGDNAPWWASMIFGGVAIAAGVGIFLHFYPRDARPHPPPPDQFNLSLPPHVTFEQAAILVGMHEQRAVRLEGFEASELKAVLRASKLKCRSAIDALQQLGALSLAAPIGAYDVFEQGGPIIVRRR